MLAFSSDVSHWRKKQELVGVSVRYVLLSVFDRSVAHNDASQNGTSCGENVDECVIEP